ncbi:RTA1 like protein-domain-containing protein [Thermoascus aurantiacus ATCC 26904]
MASDSEDSIYFYDPSLPASILFTALYALPFLYQLYMTVIAPCIGKYNYTGYFIPILIGAGLEIAGYAVRCGSVEKPDDIALYSVSSSLIVVAPVFVCASLYLLVGRLIRFQPSGADSRRRKGVLCISPRWLPRIFVTSDVLSFLTQGSGIGLAAAGNWEGIEKDIGFGILITGLVLQLVTFVLFLAIVLLFHLQAKSVGDGIDRGHRMVLMGIYISGFFIIVRSIYRVVEFSLGIPSYTFSHEWPLYVLEAVPMLLAITVLGWFHPGRWLSKFSSSTPEYFEAQKRKR